FRPPAQLLPWTSLAMTAGLSRSPARRRIEARGWRRAGGPVQAAAGSVARPSPVPLIPLARQPAGAPPRLVACVPVRYIATWPPVCKNRGRHEFRTSHRVGRLAVVEDADPPVVLVASAATGGSPELEEGRFILNDEPIDFVRAEAQQARDVLGRTVSEANPDDLRWWTEENAQAVEILVLRDEDEAVCGRPGPDRPVRRPLEPERGDMCGVRIGVREIADQARCEVLVEEQLHGRRRGGPASRPQAPGTLESFRSRSAANARQARMSSRASWGNWSRISSSLIPPAR